MRTALILPLILALLLGGCSHSDPDRCQHGTGAPVAAQPAAHIKTVFVVVMENHDWSQIRGSASAPFINGTMLPQGSHAEQYFNPPGLHPSEPNYLWLEGGTNYGVDNDDDPAKNHQAATDHLVTLLDRAGIPWKSYQEDIPGTDCPLTAVGKYAPKHNPMVFFDDVTAKNDPRSQTCIQHVRPLAELERDLTAGTAARYNFVTPNLCNDMHDACASGDRIKNGDAWLAAWVPKILASQQFQQGGALFVTWDEGADSSSDGPIGMIVLSPFAKGNGYANQIHYTHGSTLRTLQEIFGVGPLLCDANNQQDLSDLFAQFP